MRKLLSLIVMLAICSTPIPAMAKSAPSVYVNDTLIKTDQAPIVRNGTTLLPVRAVFEGLRLKVNFNSTGAVWSQLGNSTLSVMYSTPSQNTHIVIDPNVNETADEQYYYNFNYPPVIANNRSLIPVRFIAESLGLQVNWDKEANAVRIKGDLPSEFKVMQGGSKEKINKQPKIEKKQPQKATPQKSTNVPKEYTNALKKAKDYARILHLSKNDIHKQLLSSFEQFSEEATQYAMNNLYWDFKANALATAENYQRTMALSPSAIQRQLEYHKFTPEEIEYAMTNLSK